MDAKPIVDGVIMEHVGKNLNTIYGTLHYPSRSVGNADGSSAMVPTATAEFHIYKLQWDESTIKISVHGNVFHPVTNSQSLPFNQDFFSFLTLSWTAILVDQSMHP